jgi:outer membrane protein OmpA-like peptidoglycan-associated protein
MVEVGVIPALWLLGRCAVRPGWLACGPRASWRLTRLALRCLMWVPLVAMAADTAPDGRSSPILSVEQIEQALHPPMTRGFTPRGLARRDQVSQSVYLNIPFEYNSSALQRVAFTQLRQLQLALASQGLRSDRFVVAGHTDARGNPQYNKELSLRRAQTVKQFLVARGINASRLDTVGYGSDRLLVPDRPYDSLNRRVEIRDLGERAP